ncbi:hypothetical protein Ancab_011885 [Ancistrocladus abbreviatus]
MKSGQESLQQCGAECHESRSRSPAFSSLNDRTAVAVGSSFLTQIISPSSTGNPSNSSITVKPRRPIFELFDQDSLSSCHGNAHDEYNPSCESNELCWFLKSCSLCNKPLKPDGDVYMYRGDQVFCSTECRSWQIVLDDLDLEELDAAAAIALNNNHYHRAVELSFGSKP